MNAPRCGYRGCPHAAHRNECPAKNPTTTVLLIDYETGHISGRLCGRTRQPCMCPYRTCQCGTALAVAFLIPSPAHAPLEVFVVRGSSRSPDATVRVWLGPNGELLATRITDDNRDQAGWVGVEHECAELAAAVAGQVAPAGDPMDETAARGWLGLSADVELSEAGRRAVDALVGLPAPGSDAASNVATFAKFLEAAGPAPRRITTGLE